MSTDFVIFCLDDFADDLEQLAIEMPDVTATAQSKVANRFKKRVLQKTPKTFRSYKRKLKASYRLKKEGFLDEQMTIFSSIAPHFHLVERGYKVVSRKAKSGSTRKSVASASRKDSVKGKFMVAETITEFEPIYEQELSQAFDNALRKVK